MFRFNFYFLLVAILCGFQSVSSAQTLKIYTTRKQAQIQPLLDVFTKENPKVKFTVVTATNWNLVTALEKQGPSFDGDIYLTKDLVYLNEETEKGFFRKLDTTVARKNIPDYMIDTENHWVGLALRARTMVYNPNAVRPEELSTYEALSGEEWIGRMCLRTSLSSYSVGFTASLIHNLGDGKALEILKGWVLNAGIDPTIGDELLLESIDSGICGVGIINTHYFATSLMSNPKLNAKVFFANQKTSGTHMNGSGVAILRNSTQPELAQKFVDFLTRADVQTEFAKQQMEYPANPAAKIPVLLQSFGSFKRDTTSWTELGKYLMRSRELFIEADYN